jgi:hypothetical protein
MMRTETAGTAYLTEDQTPGLDARSTSARSGQPARTTNVNTVLSGPLLDDRQLVIGAHAL